MFYRVIKDGFKHPHSNKPLKKGDVIDLFHLTGNSLTEGKNPPLAHTKKVDKNTAMVMAAEIKKDLEG